MPPSDRLAAAACSALLALGAMAPPAAASGIGAPMPDFTATSLDGTRISLAEAAKAHKAVVVLFLSTVCPYANFFAGHLRDLDARYGPRGVMLIGVNSNQYESEQDMRDNAREHGQKFPLVRDEGARIADLLGAARTPEAFLIGADGRLRYHGWVQSKLRSPDLERAIEATLAGERVPRRETKAFGCAIDRDRP